MKDQRAADLYRRFGPVIYARCLKILADTAAAEDAAQETFIRVFRHIEKAPDDTEVIAWIYRIATNYCLNELRNRKRRPQPTEVLPEPASGDVQEMLADRDLVKRIVMRAPEEEAQVAWLYYVDGIEQGEVGKVLGISRRTVQNKLTRFQTNAQKYLRRSA